MKEEITKLLESTQRVGIDGLIEYLEDCGFFTAPCSGGYHLAKEGGLAEHSLNALRCAEKLGVAWLGGEEYNKIHDSVIICSLLHDLGKCGDFGKPNYIPNVLKSGEVSKTKPYETNKQLLNVPHEVRSIKLATLFIDLTEDEEFAILMHNGLYGPFYRELKGNETLLYMILHFADMWASRIVEKE